MVVAAADEEKCRGGFLSRCRDAQMAGTSPAKGCANVRKPAALRPRRKGRCTPKMHGIAPPGKQDIVWFRANRCTWAWPDNAGSRSKRNKLTRRFIPALSFALLCLGASVVGCKTIVPPAVKDTKPRVGGGIAAVIAAVSGTGTNFRLFGTYDFLELARFPMFLNLILNIEKKAL